MTELLAPAGNMDCFNAAIGAGADAVYLGGSKYGARAFADNFSEEELIKAIRLAHLYHKKLYLTVNTLLREQELDLLPAFLKPFYEEGLDGVIVADLGVISLLHDVFPDLPLHASTQMTITGPRALFLLEKEGVCRAVPARELSIKELSVLRENSDMELEVFIHGAMCYAYSGQCLFSSMLGQRSGNRGRCGGPCRLPYDCFRGTRQLNEASQKYQLSLKDLCALPLLGQLMDLGIDSFKIEGRMKSPDYVYGVTAIYRKYMDQYTATGTITPDQKDLAFLENRFNRGGMETGYLNRHNGRDMVLLNRSGYQGSSEDTKSAKETDPATDPKKGPEKIPVTGTLLLTLGSEILLTLKAASGDSTFETSAQTAPLEKAINHPSLTEQIVGPLKKLGNTPFRMQELSILYRTSEKEEFEQFADEKSDIFLPVKILNDLRREAAEKLEEKMLSGCKREVTDPYASLIASSEEELSAGRMQGLYKKDRQGKFKRNSVGEFRRDKNKLFQMENRTGGNITYRNSALKQDKTETRTEGSDSQKFVISIRTIDQLRSIKAEMAERIGSLWLSYDLMRIKALLPAAFEHIQELQDSNPDLKLYCRLPSVTRQSVSNEISKLLETEHFARLDGMVCGSLEAVALLKEKGYEKEILSDCGLYAFQSQALHVFEKWGIFVHALPYELQKQELEELVSDAKEMDHAFILPIYGYIPVMVSAGCLATTNRACMMEYPAASKIGRAAGERIMLTDRMNKSFPVLLHCDRCENTIYNTVPLSLHKDMADVHAIDADALLLSFTVETGEETESITRYFLQEKPGSVPPLLKNFTRGHFLKGVE